MAKPIVLVYKGQEAQFDFEKVDRAKLYGKIKRIPLDPDGAICKKAELTEDGAILIRSGMTAQGYFDEDANWIPNKQMVGFDLDGQPLTKVPSTLGVPVDATKATPEELLDMNVLSIYQLDATNVPNDFLSDGILKFTFNYRADYHAEQGFLVKNDAGYFAIIGNPVEPQWLELEHVAQEQFSDDDDDDELDFEMF